MAVYDMWWVLRALQSKKSRINSTTPLNFIGRRRKKKENKRKRKRKGETNKRGKKKKRVRRYLLGKQLACLIEHIRIGI